MVVDSCPPVPVPDVAFVMFWLIRPKIVGDKWWWHKEGNNCDYKRGLGLYTLTALLGGGYPDLSTHLWLLYSRALARGK